MVPHLFDVPESEIRTAFMAASEHWSGGQWPGGNDCLAEPLNAAIAKRYPGSKNCVFDVRRNPCGSSSNGSPARWGDGQPGKRSISLLPRRSTSGVGTQPGSGFCGPRSAESTVETVDSTTIRSAVRTGPHRCQGAHAGCHGGLASSNGGGAVASWNFALVDSGARASAHLRGKLTPSVAMTDSSPRHA